jgi:hypothetical protein
MEYVPGGSIGSMVLRYGSFEGDVIKSFCAQILDGLAYLHTNGIMHRVCAHPRPVEDEVKLTTATRI